MIGSLNVVDTIECHDKNDLVNTSMELAKENIETDFLYNYKGQEGLWLLVVDTKKRKPRWFYEGL